MRESAVALALALLAALVWHCGDDASTTAEDAGSGGGDPGGGTDSGGGGRPCTTDKDCAAFERCTNGQCRIPDLPDTGAGDAGATDTGGGVDASGLSDVPDASDLSDLSGPADAGPPEDTGAPVDAGTDSGADAGHPQGDGGRDAGAADTGVTDAGAADTGVTDAGAGPCPQGMTCVHTFPFGEDRDTSKEPQGKWGSYSCKPTVDEGGPEIIYRVTVAEAGFLSAAVIEQPGVDVDVHILSAPDPGACLDRGNYHAKADVDAGVYYVVIDTYVSGGVPQAGAFHVDIGFTVPSRGPCDALTGEMARVGDGGNHLAMPATGPVVMEAHLVTQDESYRPSTATQHLSEHYALSQSKTGFVMHRQEQWAPLEGGSFYGCGIGDPANFPVVHEGWYVNMYWTSAARPAAGSRMILRLPNSNRAVVVAAGYETGPGDLSMVGGTPEETHFYLGTAHGSTMQIGIATDQTLPFGPRACE